MPGFPCSHIFRSVQTQTCTALWVQCAQRRKGQLAGDRNVLVIGFIQGNKETPNWPRVGLYSYLRVIGVHMLVKYPH